MLHETEEYIFPGGFGPFFNIDIFKLDTPDAPIDENFIFYINVLLIWIILPTFRTARRAKLPVRALDSVLLPLRRRGTHRAGS
jgi:hypothetical protein